MICQQFVNEFLTPNVTITFVNLNFDALIRKNFNFIAASGNMSLNHDGVFPCPTKHIENLGSFELL